MLQIKRPLLGGGKGRHGLRGSGLRRGLNSNLFSPLSIVGLELWLKTVCGPFQEPGLTVPAVADGDPVGGWRDFSGNGNHATQATNRPTLKLAVQNNLNVLLFDSVNNGLLISLSLVVPFTLMLVEKPPTIPGGSHRTINSNTTNSLISLARTNNSNATDGGGNVSNFAVADTLGHVASLIVPSTGASYFVDGTDRTTTSGTHNNWGTVSFGFTGSIVESANTRVCEVLAFNVALTANQRQQLEAYERAKWGTV